MSTPLAVIRYLAELDAALADRNVADRDAVVNEVSEHIAGALAEISDPTDADIAAILGTLGDPLAIAEETASLESTPDRAIDSPQPTDTTTTPTDRATATAAPWLARPWIPGLAAILYLVAEVQILVPRMMNRPVPNDWAQLIPSLLNFWWLVSIVLVVISPLYRAAATVVWIVSFPMVGIIVPLMVRDLFNSPNRTDAGFGYVVGFGLPIAAAAAAIWLSVVAVGRARPGRMISGAAASPESHP